jgi:hypothetical protein
MEIIIGSKERQPHRCAEEGLDNDGGSTHRVCAASAVETPRKGHIYDTNPFSGKPVTWCYPECRLMTHLRF